MSKKIKDVTVIDYTNVVLNKVNEIYSNQDLKNKALFILYLINRGSNLDPELGYQLNVTNHRNILGFNGSEFKELFDPLVSNGVIKCTTPHSKGKASKRYIITQPYKWVKNQGEIKNIYKGENYYEFPKYIQQFHLDNRVVKNAEETIWSKNYQYVPKEELTKEMQSEFKEMQYKVTIMEELIDSMRKEIDALKALNKIQPPTENEELKSNVSKTVEGKVEEIKNEINVYRQFALDRVSEGITDFETLYTQLYNKFILDGMPEEIEKQLNEILYDTVESVLEK